MSPASRGGSRLGLGLIGQWLRFLFMALVTVGMFALLVAAARYLASDVGPVASIVLPAVFAGILLAVSYHSVIGWR